MDEKLGHRYRSLRGDRGTARAAIPRFKMPSQTRSLPRSSRTSMCKRITNQAVDALAERGLPPRVADPLHALSGPMASGVQGFVRTEVGKVVASDAFADAWVSANRAGHQAMVAALTGQTGQGVTIANDTVTINLGPFIQVVKQRLVERGFDLASRVPDVNPSFTVLQSDAIGKAQSAFSLLNALGNWLPVITLILLAVGIYVAKDHRRALLGAGLGTCCGHVSAGTRHCLGADALPQCASSGRADAGCCSFVLRHPRALPPARAAYGAGVWPHRRAGGLLDRPVDHRGPDSGWLEQRYCVVARRC